MDETSGSVILPATPESVAEGDVTSQNVFGAIRTLREQGVAKKEIARSLGLDVKTVRKWLRRCWAPQRRRRGRLLDRFAGFMRVRALEVGFNAVVLTRELRALGYAGSYAAVVKYIAPWRAQARPGDEPTVRFETGPGEQAQVDWGSAALWVGEQRVRVHLFVMVLGYSRRLFARAYPSEGLDALLDAHERAFAHFGGRTESILYDNPRTIVTRKDEATGDVVWNGTFKDRMDFYGVRVRLCRYYRARTKGKVESGVKYVKRNALVGRCFASLQHLNDELVSWCVGVADQREHGTTHERPAERFARAERLIPVDLRPPAARERVVVRRVARDAFVAVEANRYPVPYEWAGRQVEVRVLPAQVMIHHEGSAPVGHARLEGKHQVARWSGPPRPMPRAGHPAVPEAPRLDVAFVGGVGEVDVRPLSRYQEVAS